MYLSIRDLSKRYGEVVAVDDVSLNIEEGEFVSILGPSGSGKTTTLHMLAGFEPPDSGTVFLDGEDITNKQPEDREMGMVFQDLALFPHMTVGENVAFGLKMRTSFSGDKIESKVQNVLELVELLDFEDRMVTNLSGGQRQRVALARAIVIEPKVILYDEPLSDLDKNLREHMRREIADLHKELGITSLYVTHNQREALTLSDRIAIMRDGGIEQYDTPAQVYERPNNKFVADFIGDSNFIKGLIEVSEDESTVFENDTFRLSIGDSRLYTTNNGTLFIRPEELEIGVDPSEGNTFSCQITNVDHLGSTTEYKIEVDNTDLLVTELGPPRFDVGDRTYVKIKHCEVLENNGP